MNKKLVKKLVLLLTMGLTMGMAVGCSGLDASEKEGSEITIGSKTFTENIVLGKILVKYLDNQGYNVVDETGLGETGIMRQAITSGEIDGCFEYTGTGLMQFMKHDPVFNSDECYKLIRDFDKKNGIVWLDYAQANNTYALAMPKEVAEKYNLKNASDLAKAYNDGKHIKFVTAAESYERPDMMPRLFSVYGFNIDQKDRLMLDLGLFYDALKNGEGEVTTGFMTDGRIKSDNLVVLDDDKSAFAVYNIAPVFRQEIIDEYPELPQSVKKLTDLLDTKTVTELNYKVDVDGQEIDDVVDTFLSENGLVKQ